MNIHNGQVSAQLAGFGSIGRTLHYLSLLATSTAIKSFKASLLKGTIHSIDGHGSYKHERGTDWRDFKTAIPNTPFIHYVFLALRDNDLLLVNPDHASMLTDAYRELGLTERRAFANGRAEFANAQLPALLRRNLNEHTSLPIPPEWDLELWKSAQYHNRVHAGTYEGDCAYIGYRDSEEPLWKSLVKSLVLSGRVQ